MSLTITSPTDYSPAYNPVIVEAVSTVRDNFTIGAQKDIDSVSSVLGYSQLVYFVPHLLVAGDYILITIAPDVPELLGVAKVTSVVDAETLIINKPFTGNITATGTTWKYLNNYSMLLKFYVYFLASPSTAVLKSSKILKPTFVAGFCHFKADLSNMIKSFNYSANTVEQVLKDDLYPFGGQTLQNNNKSFVKYGFECFEAFDNPVSGTPVFIDEATA